MGAPLSRIRRLPLLGGIVAAVVVLDQVTKRIAINTLGETGAVHVYLWDFFRLQYAENTGAFLSLGAGLGDGVRFWVLTGLNVVIMSVLALVLLLKRQLSTPVLISLTLIFSGGLGNLIDRIGRDGRVVDFMNMGIGGLRTGIFNVADLAIVGGLLLLIAHEFMAARRAGVEAEADTEAGKDA